MHFAKLARIPLIFGAVAVVSAALLSSISPAQRATAHSGPIATAGTFALGPARHCVAFSATNTVSHTTSLDGDVMQFQLIHQPTPTLVGGLTFTVPYSGIYYFSWSFVRSTFPAGGSWDDVYMNLVVDNAIKAYAWAGESNPADGAKRMTGACSIALHLDAGQVLWMSSSSDGNLFREISKYEWTGFLLCED